MCKLFVDFSGCVKCLESFLGDVLSSEGIKPDPNKTIAIQEMQKPVDKKGVQRFLGMITYLAKWIPDLSTITDPLRQLLIKKNEWQWGQEQDKAWETLKMLIISPPVLKFYDPGKPIKLSSDASQNGLGAVILQLHDEEWKPVAYAARSMLEAETRYAQIEKELLSIVFACQRFHQFIYGATVEAETDHKPLVPLFIKPLNQCPIRVQRMLLILQRYDLKVSYTPGKYLVTADTLSRSNKNEKTDKDLVEQVKLHVDMVIENMPISDCRLEVMRTETARDQELCKLMENVLNGWPNSKSSCTPETAAYWNAREELSTADGVILKGTRLVIPQVMRKYVLNKIHEGHMGIEKCRQRARAHVYWPGMNAHITEMIGNCYECQVHGNKNTAEPLRPHEIPNRPWQKVGTDLFTHDGKNYLVVVDYASGYPELIQLLSTTSTAVIRSMKAIFARYGVPDVVMSDNGPQYSSKEFEEFALDWEFKHKTSSPHYPQSNGQAESAVKAMKSLVKKSKDLYKGLLAYRSTPLQHGYAPATIMMGRMVKSTLSAHPASLKTIGQEDFVAKRRKQHETQKHYHDRGKREMKELEYGQEIRIWNEKTGNWSTEGTVTGTVSPRSYLVDTPDGGQYRRNRRQLKEKPQVNEEPVKPQSQLVGSPPMSEAVGEHTTETEPSGTEHRTEHPAEREVVRRSHRKRQAPERLITKA